MSTHKGSESFNDFSARSLPRFQSMSYVLMAIKNQTYCTVHWFLYTIQDKIYINKVFWTNEVYEVIFFFNFQLPDYQQS